MGLQLIFVVETNKSCKSDWIYIKDTIDYFYQYDPAHTKLSPVYMDGKGRYKNKEKEILKLIAEYASGSVSKSNQSKVVYCFDCDDCKTKPEDSKFLEEARQYCREKHYDFVWFYKDIECVYLGKKVDDSKKKKEAEQFKGKKLIKNADANKLSVQNYVTNTSNIMKVIDQYLTRREQEISYPL